MGSIPGPRTELTLAEDRGRAASTWSVSLAIREFALGVEAFERSVRREPLYRVHDCT